jgi:hypothetical protein
MADVYSGAAVTIAATAAEDSSQGCFVAKDGWRESVPVEITTRSAHKQHQTIFVREQPGPLHDLPSGPEDPFVDLPLTGRAWVHQERILSTRILMYSDCELSFECRTSMWCECGLYPHCLLKSNSSRESYAPWFSKNEPAGLRRREILGRTANVALSSLSLTPALRQSLSGVKRAVIDKHLLNRRETYAFWHRAVSNYTKRCLTYDRDVLPAISAVAGLVKSKLGDEYLAGLWRDELPVALLWCRVPAPFRLPEEQLDLLENVTPDMEVRTSDRLAAFIPRRTKEDCPPTWSWASVRVAIAWNGPFLLDENSSFRKIQHPAVVHKAFCSTSKVNPTGTVVAGELDIEGYLQEVRLYSCHFHRKTLLHRCRVADVSCKIGMAEIGIGDDEHIHDDLCLARNEHDWAVLDIPLPHAAETLRVWRLRVGVFPPTGEELLSPNDITGNLVRNIQEFSVSHHQHYFLLLVRRSQGNDRTQREVYERIGIFARDVGPKTEGYHLGKRKRILIM